MIGSLTSALCEAERVADLKDTRSGIAIITTWITGKIFKLCSRCQERLTQLNLLPGGLEIDKHDEIKHHLNINTSCDLSFWSAVPSSTPPSTCLRRASSCIYHQSSLLDVSRAHVFNDDGEHIDGCYYSVKASEKAHHLMVCESPGMVRTALFTSYATGLVQEHLPGPSVFAGVPAPWPGACSIGYGKCISEPERPINLIL